MGEEAWGQTIDRYLDASKIVPVQALFLARKLL